MIWLGYFYRGGGSSKGPEQARALFRALLPCLALIASVGTAAHAQTVTPDLFSPDPRPARSPTPDLAAAPDRGGGEPIRSTIRGCSATRSRAARRRASARSRPTACRPPAAPQPPATTRSTASARSRNIIRARPGRKPPIGPGSRRAGHRIERAAAALDPAVGDRPTRRRCRRRWPAPCSASRRASGCKIDDDPFGAVGDYAGSFLIKSAVEFSGGYDTNPGRLNVPQGSPFYRGRAGISGGLRLGAPRAGRRSARLLHRLQPTTSPPNADGTPLSAPLDVDRPNFIGHVDGRLDVTPRHAAARPGAAAGRHRQSRQPERAGRPRQISGLRHVRRHLRRRPELQSPAGFRAAPPSTAPIISSSKLTDGTSTTQRRPQLQPVWRRRPRQLRADAGPETVRARSQGDRRVARPLSRPQRLRARFQRRLRQGPAPRFEFSRHADRRNLRSATPRATYADPRLNRLRGPAHLGLAGLAARRR